MLKAIIGYTGFVGGNISSQHSFDLKYNSSNINEIKEKSLNRYIKSTSNLNNGSDNSFSATSNDPQLIINIDNLRGLEFDITGTSGFPKLYYSFSGEPAVGWYSEKYSDAAKSDHVLLNIPLLEKMWGKKLTELRIDPTDQIELFFLTGFKMYQLAR